jgi:hypothetical protein
MALFHNFDVNHAKGVTGGGSELWNCTWGEYEFVAPLCR